MHHPRSELSGYSVNVETFKAEVAALLSVRLAVGRSASVHSSFLVPRSSLPRSSLPRASCLVPRASCLVPRASCLVASCLVPRASVPRASLPRASCLVPSQVVLPHANRRAMTTRAKTKPERDPGAAHRHRGSSGLVLRGTGERGTGERGSSERGSSERGSSERGSSERGSTNENRRTRIDERGTSERGTSERGTIRVTPKWPNPRIGEGRSGAAREPGGKPPLRCALPRNADIASVARALMGLPARPPKLLSLREAQLCSVFFQPPNTPNTPKRRFFSVCSACSVASSSSLLKGKVV